MASQSDQSCHSKQLWQELRQQAEAWLIEPMTAQMLRRQILDKENFAHAISHLMAEKLTHAHLPAHVLEREFIQLLDNQTDLLEMICCDLHAVRSRDPACDHELQALLFFKGVHALIGYRLGHALYLQGQHISALLLQSRISAQFAVDIHPAAQIGKGIMMDHATGIVIGESAVVGDYCSLLHHVTLGGTGKDCCDRHPKIGQHVMIGAGAKVLGNIQIGDGVRIAAGSVVLKPVPPHTTVAGVPARMIGTTPDNHPEQSMDQTNIETPEDN